ncbi:MAG: penicillin-binding protein activator [Alphaproteobacteria bacterium]|nr:penicillin-binding protein activator [Alphaproteobacteria bacterium]
MLKKIAFCFFAFWLGACQQILPQGVRSTSSSQGWSYAPFEVDDYALESDSFSSDSFKVAMLLPLSGKASTFGKGLQNAAMMALEDTGNKKLEVRFYDTKSSPDGAIAALSSALSAKAELILGPLMAEEVSAVSRTAKNKNVPVISFSTAPHILGGGVYTLGLLSDEQVDRIISYACSTGRSKIGVVVPDSNAGLNIAKSAVEAAAANGASVTKIGFYQPSTLEFSDLAQKMAQDKNFDTLLIAETGNRLKAISGTFGYYDVAYPDVLFIGTSVWSNTNLNKETTLFNGVYPTISRVHGDYFNKKYKDLFGESPNTLYTYAYDGVALASALSKYKGQNLYAAITNPDGYIGMNGSFRLFEDGTNEHNLDVVEVTSQGLQTVSEAPKKFASRKYKPSVEQTTMPQVFGKSEQEVLSKLFYQPEQGTYFNIF